MFSWEVELLDELLLLLHSATLVKETGDEWLWGREVSGVYSSKSGYGLLEEQFTQAPEVNAQGVEYQGTL